MNTFSKNSFLQKLFKSAMMIIILLQTACAANVTKLGGGQNDRTAPCPSKLASNGSDPSLTCGLDIPVKVSARPKVQPIADGDDRMGARIVLLLHNQQEMAGRLLSVRDSALIISTNEAQDNHIDAPTAGLLVVKNQHIQRVIIKGKSRVQKGVFIGFLVGAGTGAIIGFAAGDDPPCSEGGSPLAPCWRLTAEGKGVIGGILGGGAGLIVGGIIGVVVSEEEASDPLMNHDFSALKSLAQFPEKEPEYLSAVK